jgi:hypothetical protein
MSCGLKLASLSATLEVATCSGSLNMDPAEIRAFENEFYDFEAADFFKKTHNPVRRRPTNFPAQLVLHELRYAKKNPVVILPCKTNQKYICGLIGTHEKGRSPIRPKTLSNIPPQAASLEIV